MFIGGEYQTEQQMYVYRWNVSNGVISAYLLDGVYQTEQ